MKTYSVKQIAKMLNKNPETVRRWIREGKLQAVQVSRKGGNSVSEEALKKFLETFPMQLSQVGAAMMISPVLGTTTLAGRLVASYLISYYSAQKQSVTRIKKEDFIAFLSANADKVRESISQKETLIKQTEDEIAELQSQLDQYQYVLKNDGLIEKTIALAENSGLKMEGE